MTTSGTATDIPRLVLHIGEAEDRYARCGLCRIPNLDHGPGTSSAEGDIRMVAIATNARHGEPAKRICNTCADRYWPGARLAAAALDHFAGAIIDAPTELHRGFFREAVKGSLDTVMRMVCDSYPIVTPVNPDVEFEPACGQAHAHNYECWPADTAETCPCGGGESHPCLGCGQPTHRHREAFGDVHICLNSDCAG